MYSWGDDTSTWKKGGYKYDGARRSYLDKLSKDSAKKGKRTYERRSEPDFKLVGTKDKIISSQSKNPLVIACDVTGSMSRWPLEIFDRLPLLYQTLSQYKSDLEVSFAAIGDAYSDRFPLQVNDFGKGTALDDHLKALFPEGNGGGTSQESYELFGHYMLKKSKTPNAEKPFMIIFGDEGFYPKINAAQVRHYLGGQMKKDADSNEMWKELGKKYDVYLLRKRYGHGEYDKKIISQWSEVIGEQKIIPVEKAERAVDIAMGLIARNWGHYGDFKTNLNARQDEKDQETVYKSLEKTGMKKIKKTGKSKK